MTTFDDGPAIGVTLNIRRAPIFLRVVRDESGRWDALDQLDDRPRSNERIFAYKKSSDGGMIHINSRDRKTGQHTGGFFCMCTYSIVVPQPSDDILRDNNTWIQWCQAAHESEQTT